MNCNSGNNEKYVIEAQMNLIFVKAVKQSKIIKKISFFKVLYRAFTKRL